MEIIERMCERNKLLIRVFQVRVLLHSGWRLYPDVGRWKKAGDSIPRPPRTYSELAARVLFGHMVDLVPCYSLEEVLERGKGGVRYFFVAS